MTPEAVRAALRAAAQHGWTVRVPLMLRRVGPAGNAIGYVRGIYDWRRDKATYCWWVERRGSDVRRGQAGDAQLAAAAAADALYDIDQPSWRPPARRT